MTNHAVAAYSNILIDSQKLSNFMVLHYFPKFLMLNFSVSCFSNTKFLCYLYKVYLQNRGAHLFPLSGKTRSEKAQDKRRT